MIAKTAITRRRLAPRRLLTGATLCVLSLLLIGCETISYYSQAARGQLSILSSRQDIEAMLASEKLSDEMADAFQQVLEIRDFAGTDLYLPVKDHYATYVQLDREHVVWNVFAAPEFSTQPLRWCFPVAGCVSYRGYFSEAEANRYADQLRARGYDVYVGGVDAYSTLGWFEDSVLSTVIKRQGSQLAGLIFHELAHQVAYVPGDTTFNESFATAVQREGVRRWLDEEEQEGYLQTQDLNQQRRREFVRLVRQFRNQFSALYASGLPEAEMRAAKRDLQAGMRDAYDSLKQSWGGYLGYDGWFDKSLNNAQLATVGSYNDLVPFFTNLLQEEGGDIRAFYRRVQDIAALDESERKSLVSGET